jgi:hypothetical protein
VAGRRGTIFLLLGMLVWIVAGFGGALAGAVVMGVGSILVHGRASVSVIPEPDRLAYVLMGAIGFQGTLLLGALRQGRGIGGGDWRTGLGIRPIQRVRAVVLLCAAMVGFLLAFIGLAAAFPALREFAKSVTPDVLSALGNGGPGIVAMHVVLVAIVAP